MGIFGGNDDERPSIRVLAKQAKNSADPRQAADLLAEAGARALEVDKARKAVTYLRGAIDKAPDHARASALLEETLAKLGDDLGLATEQARRLEVLAATRGDAREMAATHARLAHTLERTGRLDGAFEHYARAFELDPSQIGVAQAARRVAVKTERWQDASNILESEIAVEPDRTRRSELFRIRARIVRDHLADMDLAVQLFERAVRTLPSDVETRRELVDTLLMRAETTDDPDRRSRDRYTAADILVDLVNAVDPDDQIMCVREALDVSPEHSPALELYEELAVDEPDQLLIRWEKHVQAFPDGPKADEVRWRLARELSAAGRPEDALSWFEELARRGDLEAILRAVELHDAAERRVEARRWAKASFEVIEESDELELHQKLFSILAPGDPEGAAEHALALLAENPDHEQALELVVRVRTDKGDRAGLAEVYADVCSRSPSRRKQYLPTLGLLLEELGDVPAALLCFREAEGLTSGPDSANARSHRVRLAELAGEWDELAALLEEDVGGLSPQQRVPILEKLATMHRGLRGDQTKATEALLSLLGIVEGDRVTGVHRDLSATLETAGAESTALERAEAYAQSASPELRADVYRILARLFDEWGQTARAAEAWALVREAHPEDTEALERSVELAIVQERYAAALELLELWVKLVSGKEAVRLHRRIAELAEEHLSNVDRAADALTAALELAQDDRELAAEAAAALRRAQRFGEEKIVLGLLLSSALDAESRRVHQERMARLSADQLQDPDEALRMWTQLVGDTNDAAELEKLRDDAREEGDAARLDVILARLAAVTTDPDVRSGHALERAEILATDLGRPQLAMKVLAHAAKSFGQKNVALLEHLENLAKETGDQRMQARALEAQVPLTEGKRKRYVLRLLAKLYEGPLKETTGMVRALSRWEEMAPDEIDPRVALLPALAEREDWGGLLARLDDLIRLARKDRQRWIDIVAEAATEAAHPTESNTDEAESENARAWFLIEVAGRAEAPAQRLRLVVGAADRFAKAGRFQEALTATTRALELVGAGEELLDRAERFAESAGASAKLDALYEQLIEKAPTEADSVALALRHSNYLTARGRSDEAVDRLLRVSALMPTNEVLLDELETLAPRSGRMDDVLLAYVDRGHLIGGEEAVGLLCRGARVAYRAGKSRIVQQMLREAVNEAGDEDTLLDRIEAAAERLGREGTEQLVRVYESRGNDPAAPNAARAKALVRAARRMKAKLGLQEVAFGVLKTALALAPTEKGVLDAIEESAVERDLLDHLDQHLSKMVAESTDRREAAALVARQAQIYEQRLGRKSDAIDSYMRSISMNPDDEGVMRRLRFCLIESGRVQELTGLLERRIARLDDDQERVSHLRQLARLWEEEANNPWEAADTWKRVIELAPDDPEAREAIARLAQSSRVPPPPPPEREPEPTTAVSGPPSGLEALPPVEPEDETAVSGPPPPPPYEGDVKTAVSGPPEAVDDEAVTSERPAPPEEEEEVTSEVALPPPRKASGPPAPPPIPAAALANEEVPEVTTNRRIASPPTIAEAETAEIPLPPPKPKPKPSQDGDLPSIIVDPKLLDD